MSESANERPTKVYTRCEVCGTIARPKADGSLPDGWVVLPATAKSNVAPAACSAECARKYAARAD
jgi:hypothetical protein